MNTVILGVAVLGLALGVLYTLFKPQWAILFIIILYPLEQLLTTVSTFFATNAKVLNLIVGGVAVVGVVSAFLGQRMPFRGYLNPAWFFTLALYVWAIMGVAYAPDRSKAIEDLTVGLPYLGLLLVFPGLLVNDLPDFRRLIVPTMVIGTAIIGLIITSPNTSMFGGRLGISGSASSGTTILNPLATATLGGTIAIMAVLYKPDRNILFVNLVRGGALTAGLAIAMLSGSRGQLLGALFASFVMFPFARQIKNIMQFLAVSVSGVVAAGFGFVVLSLVTTSDAAGRWDADTLEAGVGNRWEMILVMTQTYLSKPISYVQGLGTSAFTTYYTQGDIPYVHNMPAQILTEHGLVGVVLLGLVMLFVVRSALRLLGMYKDSPTELSTAAILIAICLYQLFLSLKQGSFFTSAVPFWWFLVLVKIHSRTVKDAQDYWAWDEQYGTPDEQPELVGAA